MLQQLQQEPLSIMREDTFSNFTSCVENVLPLCLLVHIRLVVELRVLWIIINSPSHGYTPSLFSFSSPPLTSSLWLLYSSFPLKSMVLLFGYWATIWPLKTFGVFAKGLWGYHIFIYIFGSFFRFFLCGFLPFILSLGIRVRIWTFHTTWSFSQIFLFNFDTKLN